MRIKKFRSFEFYLIIQLIINQIVCIFVRKPWFDKFSTKNNGEIKDEFLNEYLSYLKIISDENILIIFK